MFNTTKQLHIFRSVVALVLALTVVLSAAPIAYADTSGTCGDGVEWSLVGGHLTISGKGAMTNFTDENMAPWYASAAEITKVSVGSGVTRIGALAFYGCTNLTSVVLPEGITKIGDRAFKNCTALPYLTFPTTLTSIGEAAFESCEKLNGIRLPNGLKIIRDYAFYRCSALSTITVPASVTSFGMVVFAYCENLTHATLNCPLEKVPDWTFYGCEKLSSVTLPETADTAGEYAFHECQKLETIHYTGESAQELMDDIRKDESSIPVGGVITDQPFGGTGSTADTTVTESTITTDSTAATETENSIITKTETTESTFFVNGEQATVEEVASAGSEDTLTSESITTTTITATITNPQAGWEEVNAEIETETEYADPESDRVEAIIRVPDSKVEGDDLAGFSGKDVTVNIITPENDVWEIYGKDIREEAVAGNTYDFGLTISEVKAGKTGIDSEHVYKLKFAKDVNFPVTVGAQVGHAYRIATLYVKNGGSYEDMGSVVIDKGGTAWLAFSAIEKKAEYYVGIDVAGKTEQDAVIPKTLYSEYGLNKTLATLTDAEGNYYEITGNASAWGITAKQFAIYAGIAVAAAVVIVTLAMFTWNKIKQSKARYSVNVPDDYSDDDDDDDWEPIDEEALRMEIMRELLGEKNE